MAEEYDLDNLPPGFRVLESGVLFDGNKGRFVKKVRDNPHAITGKNVHEFTRRRKEKTARLLRQAIVSETGDLLKMPTTGPAAAVAAAGGILWREIVLNEGNQAYPRDRIEAFEKLGRIAGVIGDPREQDTPMVQATEFTAQLSALVMNLTKFIEAKTAGAAIQTQLHDTIDGETVD